MNDCPSAATLARLGLDTLGEMTLASLGAHIEECDHCRARLDRLHENGAGTTPDKAKLLPPPEAPPKIPGFVIECELGRGAMGVVYQAFQPGLNRRVALKVVRSGPGAAAQDHARWLREARAISSVRHPNVVPLLHVGEADGWLCLVLELVAGGNLERRLDAPYAPRDAATTLLGIAEGVAAIHESGLVHLDLKPSNILLDAGPGAPRESAVPRVTDLGIARRLGDPGATTATASLAGPMGTPSYMAPEQVEGDPKAIDHRADIYGLGAILYHLLTGHPPFKAASVVDTLEQVRHQAPVPPRRSHPKIPRDLETICLKCLHKEPTRRYGSARAVADDLRRHLDGRPIVARPVSSLERAWRWGRRHPAVAALSAAFFLALAGGFLGMSVYARRADIERGRAERERSQAQQAQARAEADYRTAFALVNQLIDLNAGGWGCAPRATSPEETATLLRNTRRQFLELAPRAPDLERLLFQLVAVDTGLKRVLNDQGRWDELRTLYEESLRVSDAALRRSPRTVSAWRCQVHHHPMLAEIADRQGKAQEREAHLRQAIACAEEWARLEPTAEPHGTVAWCRKYLARVLTLQGRSAEARDLLLANQRLLWRCAPDIVDERIVAERLLSHVEPRHLDMEVIPPPAPGDAGLPDACTVLGSAGSDDLPATAWAKLAIAGLHSAAGGRPIPNGEAQAAYWFARGLIEIGMNERKQGRRDRARQTADRLLAFGQLMVERNPKHAAAHIVLAEAFVQVYKNAYRPTEDRPTIERSLKQAIAAAQKALELSPYDSGARQLVERLRLKLHSFLHPR